MKLTKQLPRVLSLLLTIILFATLIATPVSAKYFTDIPSNYSEMDAVNYMSDNGFINGIDNYTFSPNTELSRAMAVTILYRKAGSPLVVGSTPFTDVPENSWYATPVKWAYYNGIVNGTSSSTFSPNLSVTRQDAVTCLARYAVSSNYPVSSTYTLPFTDTNSISGYALTFVKWAVENELISGRTSTMFMPQSYMTRIEFASLVTKYGTNIEKIRPKIDNLGVGNFSSNFRSPYYVVGEHENRMLQVLNEYYGAGSPLVTTLMAAFNTEKQKIWYGSCYGISIVTILDKMGKIAFNENYSTANKMYGVTSVKGTLAESAINYYQLSPMVTGQDFGTEGSTLLESLQNAKNVIDNSNGPVLLTYYHNTYLLTLGHTVVVNSAEIENGNYVFYVVDSMYPNANNPVSSTGNIAKMVVNPSTGWMTELSTSRHLTRVLVKSDLSNENGINIYDLDIDGPYNIDSANTISMNARNNSSLSEPQKVDRLINGDTVSLRIQMNDHFTLKNAEGSTLYWSGTELTGNMEYKNYTMTVEGDSNASYLIINVPYSESFSYIPDHSATTADFSIVNSYQFMKVRGAGLNCIVLDAKSPHCVTSGNCDSITLAYANANSENPTHIIQGQNAKNISLTLSEDDLAILGELDNASVKDMDLFGNVIDTRKLSVTSGEPCVISEIR